MTPMGHKPTFYLRTLDRRLCDVKQPFASNRCDRLRTARRDPSLFQLRRFSQMPSATRKTAKIALAISPVFANAFRDNPSKYPSRRPIETQDANQIDLLDNFDIQTTSSIS